MKTLEMFLKKFKSNFKTIKRIILIIIISLHAAILTSAAGTDNTQNKGNTSKHKVARSEVYIGKSEFHTKEDNTCKVTLTFNNGNQVISISTLAPFQRTNYGLDFDFSTVHPAAFDPALASESEFSNLTGNDKSTYWFRKFFKGSNWNGFQMETSFISRFNPATAHRYTLQFLFSNESLTEISEFYLRTHLIFFNKETRKKHCVNLRRI